MRRAMSVIVLIGFLIGAQALGRDAGEKKAPLQGTWIIVAAGQKGQTPSGGHWVIGEDKITLYRSNSVLDGHMAYKSDATKEPMAIDLVPDRGPAKDKTLQGIFILEGDKLKICYPSPASESPEKGERPKQPGVKGTVTFVFERQKP